MQTITLHLKQSKTIGLIILLALIALALCWPRSVSAAPDGGQVGTGTPASCTEAALNTALAGGGNVTFNCGVNPYTLTLTSGKTISINTTIDGGGKITLSGGGTVQVLFVNPGVQLTLNNLSLANGYASMGGCVSVRGTLHVTQSTFKNCVSHTAFIFPGAGGAIYNWGGTIALTNSLVLSNGVDLDGGGIFVNGGQATLNQVDVYSNTTFMTGTNSGGGIFAASGSQITMTNSHINYNRTYLRGGGVYLVGAQATLNHVDVLSNTDWITDAGSGGGVYVDANTNFVAADSNFSYNRFGYLGHGGGLSVYTSTAVLVNVSADYNQARNAAEGGGIYAKNSQFTLQGGSANGNSGLYDGGGLYLHNCVSNISNATINGNTSSADGGGLYAFQGSLSLNNATVNNNTNGEDGGGIKLYQTPTTLVSVTVNNNHSTRSGGGINNYWGALTLDRVTVSGNESVGDQGGGGGIYNDEGTLIATNSTIDHNATDDSGGGIYNTALDSTAILTNVTLSGNTAATDGGGIYNKASYSVYVAAITLTNVTLKDNRAASGGGVFNGNAANNFVYLKNTIIADSQGSGNCYGKAITSAKYSLSTDAACNLIGTGNLNNVKAQLFPLLNNGGTTKTHLPGPASPAVNSVPGTDFPPTDQRGVSRPQGLAGDMGAVERQAADPVIAPWIYLPLILR